MNVTAIILLVFGLIVMIIEFFIIRLTKARWAPYSIIRFFGLTLVMIIVLVIIMTADNSDKFTAIIGLLGTIAGYLLGKDPKEQDDMKAEYETDIKTKTETNKPID